MAGPKSRLASTETVKNDLIALGLMCGLVALLVVWPLVDFISNDDINYIRDPGHLTTVYVNSGRYVAAITSAALQWLREDIVQNGFFLRSIALFLGGCFSVLFVRSIAPSIDWLAAVLIGALVLVYPLSLDLFSFSITANVLLVLFALTIAYLIFAEQKLRRISFILILIVVLGLLNYQLIMMYAVLISLLLAYKHATDFKDAVLILFFRGIEVILAFAGYLLLRYLVEEVGAPIVGYEINVIKTISVVTDPGEMAARATAFVSKLADVFLLGNNVISGPTLWLFYATLVASVLLARRNNQSEIRMLPRWKIYLLPLLILLMVIAGANPYSVITEVGIFNNRQWGHGGLVLAAFAAFAISSVSTAIWQRILAFICFFSIAINSAAIAFEAKRTAQTEGHLANRIIAEIEAVEGFNPRITPVGVIGQLSLWYFDRDRRSYGGGLSPRITKAAYSSLSESAGYELRRPRANQSRAMKERCDMLEKETRFGIYYKIEKFQNAIMVCFFNPRNQPRK